MDESKNRRVALLGSTGFLGSAVGRLLTARGVPWVGTSLSKGTDIRSYRQLSRFLAETRPSVIINCAAFVGGIQFGRAHAAEIFANNLQMTLNIYQGCIDFGVGRLVNPISNCIYPSKAVLFKEEAVWDGPLDESVLVYGMARKLHFVGARAYRQQGALDSINLVLPNLYGPGDHFDPVRSHALGALIAKIVAARDRREPSVTIWGTGRPIREWLYVDDGAAAMVSAVSAAPFEDLINVGTGKGLSILETAVMIRSLVGYRGELLCDGSKPDGAPHKTLDGTRARALLNWQPAVTFDEGLSKTVEWYLARHEAA